MPREYDFNNCPYQVYYKTIESSCVYNKLEPSAEQIKRTEEKYPGFFKKLEESILKEGFRNPISVSKVRHKKECIFDFGKELKVNEAQPYIKGDKLFICHMHGGSRLYIAQKHQLEIPCIVADFTHSKNKTIRNYRELMDLFKDKPRSIKFREFGVFIESLPHCHLER